ncbi:uncharacterized protein PRCAT00003999001 [Priceomyces carsonii]|uniref:uncharacterized protein n=1 Tax=Priceomyces carsonii TaxID=28549 RepID=UPI002ED79E9B|nr:unnamed protein product [Priceomyces carsonii]
MVSTINLVSRAGNQALEVNPPPASIDIHLTDHGSDWLWAAFSIFGLFAICHAFIYGFTSSKTQGLRKALLPIPLFTNAIMAYTYFTYAANLGYTSTDVEFHHVTTSEDLGNRQVFYVKYIGWFLAWPFVLFSMEVAAHKLDESEITSVADVVTRLISRIQALFTKLLATEVYVLGLLIGILINSSYRWGYFTFAVSAQLFAMTLLCVQLFRSATSVASNAATYVILFEMIVWILYPINWGLSEGGNKIQPDSEAVFYGILDLITFSFVPTILTWIAISGLDENYFRNILHFRHPVSEKPIAETPRGSGETAVHEPEPESNNAVEDV